MNIYSGSGGLASALTNPTELAFRKKKLSVHYPVHFMGATYADAEMAYQVYKTGQISVDDNLMTRIILQKLVQYPDLYDQVKELGGVNFLEECNHFTGAKSAGFKSWEGRGTESRFIRNLIAGYRLAMKELK